MIFKNATNKVELNFKIEEEDAQSKGDVYLSIKIESNGFKGHNDLWVLGEEFELFIKNLILLEEKRKGEATLASISPNELKLKLHSITNRGHIVISGKTGYTILKGETSFWHSIEFGFEFDPSQLKEEIERYRTNRSN